ncbi:TIGR02444 family protein [Hydrogenophaga sp.]|uniref:TIGR02444 family protein n=1 Tax=Hydrogenophaga sp. TaxID=1904254 RepID=UPI0027258064|nr:TIGR02444 family protein [Hydrogenophaga sp.]MDO9434395.1 TIGR02444 family protein [Hydrogenophaga sp.]
MTNEPALDDPVWRFAIGLYALPGVAEACLALQDGAHVDVCVLLYALYADAQGRSLDAAELKQADAAARPWREQVVHPLRAMRRQLKPGFGQLSADDTAPVRAQVQAAELAAEKLLLAHLHRFDVARQTPTRRDGARATVYEIAAWYGAGLGAWTPSVVNSAADLMERALEDGKALERPRPPPD